MTRKEKVFLDNLILGYFFETFVKILNNVAFTVFTCVSQYTTIYHIFKNLRLCDFPSSDLHFFLFYSMYTHHNFHIPNLVVPHDSFRGDIPFSKHTRTSSVMYFKIRISSKCPQVVFITMVCSSRFL